MPAIGRHGIAQVPGTKPATSGTIAWMRPICSGSTLLITVPRILAVERAGAHVGTVGTVETSALRASEKLCL